MATRRDRPTEVSGTKIEGKVEPDISSCNPISRVAASVSQGVAENEEEDSSSRGKQQNASNVAETLRGVKERARITSGEFFLPLNHRSESVLELLAKKGKKRVAVG